MLYRVSSVTFTFRDARPWQVGQHSSQQSYCCNTEVRW